MIIPNFSLYFESEKEIRKYLNESDESDEESEDALAPKENEGDPDGIELEDSDDLSDGDFGDDGDYESTFGDDAMDQMGQPVKPKFNGMDRNDLYSVYIELVKIISRNTGLRVDGAYDKEMGISYNVNIHNTAYWKLIRKDTLVPTYILTAVLDPSKLINDQSPKKEEDPSNKVDPEQEQPEELGAEETGGEEQEEKEQEEQPEEEEVQEEGFLYEEEEEEAGGMEGDEGMGGAEEMGGVEPPPPSPEGDGELKIEVYCLNTKKKKKLKANVDVVSKYINDLEQKVKNKISRERTKKNKGEEDSNAPKKYFI